MQGAPKRQVNAEDMLAELKRALESSTSAPDAPSRAASIGPQPGYPSLEIRRSQIDRVSDRPLKTSAQKSGGARTDPQKAARPKSRRWGLTAGGLALAGAAAVGASYAFINKAPDLPTQELSVARTNEPVRSQDELTSKSSNDSLLSTDDVRQAAPSPVGAVAPRFSAGTAPAIVGSLPASGKAEGDAPRPGSSGSESAAPALTPALLNDAAIPVPTVRIGPDGAPVATAPSTPARTDSAHPAGTPKPAVETAAPQMVKPEKAPVATPPSLATASPTPAATSSAPPPAETQKPSAPTGAPQMVKPTKASLATAPSTPASTALTPPPAVAPKPAAPAAASQMVKKDQASVATAPPTRPSTDSAPPLPQAPKPKATQTAALSNESAEPSTPKIDSKKKSSEKISQQKPAKSAKASAKPIPPERQSTEPPSPKEAEKSPQPSQNTGAPTAAAAAAKPSVQQRVADGVTHAFGYLVHLPGALIPHLGGGSDADAH
jgi:hypothetical protein